MTFGERLKYLRELRGLSQKDMAELLSVTITTLSGYESDQRKPDYEVLRRISGFFGVSEDYLFGRESFQYPRDSLLEPVCDGYTLQDCMHSMLELPVNDCSSVIRIARSLLEAQEAANRPTDDEETADE